MPSLASLPADTPIKMLLVGKPGTGKTGALDGILEADPQARIFLANYDKINISTLANVIQFDPKTGVPRPNAASKLSRVFYHNFSDTIQSINGVLLVTGKVNAFAALGGRLNDWGTDDAGAPLGGLNDWGPHDYLVVDSLSAVGEAAMRWASLKGARLNKRPEQADWGEAINAQISLIEMVNDPSIRANVIVITHIRYLGDIEGGTDAKGNFKEREALPNATGQKLPQEIGRFFNNIILAETEGTGPGLTRKLYTRQPGMLVLRTSNPGRVKPDYPIGGLGELISHLRAAPLPSASPAAQATAPAPQPAVSAPAQPVQPVGPAIVQPT